MHNAFRALTEDSMKFSTGMAKRIASDHVADVERYVADQDAVQRREASLCRTCYYINHSRIGGAAMTTWYCGLCGTERMHGSTSTPKICLECGQKESICVWCGGDVETRTKRQKWPAARAIREESNG